jgi:hypothetical protein
VPVARWASGSDLPERVELIRAALPDADRGRHQPLSQMIALMARVLQQQASSGVLPVCRYPVRAWCLCEFRAHQEHMCSPFNSVVDLVTPDDHGSHNGPR